ncbi:RAVE protein 1 C terminal-domain-containing protein, partial [Syncephalastrum racemosum]
MYLEQICPGQVNPSPHALHFILYDNVRYTLYASGSQLVIHAEPNILIQIIELTTTDKSASAITAVGGSSTSGQLAAAHGTHVTILKPYADKKNGRHVRWEIAKVIDMGLTMTCLDWSKEDHLLMADKKLSMWKQDAQGDWKEIWSKSTPTEIMYIKFEPNSTFFATVGRHDRIVTLWYNQGDDYAFTYLPHPRQVTHFVWRRLPQTSAHRFDCTLFTMARDGIGRFWSPIDLDRPHQLQMVAVVDPSQSLVTSDSNSSTQSEIFVASEEEDEYIDDVTSIHYIGCDELRNAIYTHVRNSKGDPLDHRIQRISDMIHDTPDLLFRIQFDGSLTFWGVQHLNTQPRRVPRVFVVLRVAQAIDPRDVSYFMKPVHVSHDYSHIHSSSNVKPAEMSLVGRNGHGQIRAYGLNLLDFLDTTSFVPRLHPKYTWTGHRQPICAATQTRNDRFCTVSIDGQVNVWGYGNSGQDQGWDTTQLNLLATMHIKRPEETLVVHLVQDGYVVLYNGEHVYLYSYSARSDQMHFELDISDSPPRLDTLHTYTPLHDADICLLYATSKDAQRIFWWELQLNQAVGVRSTGSQMLDRKPDWVVTHGGWSNEVIPQLFGYLQEDGMRVSTLVGYGSSLVFYNIIMGSSQNEWNALYTLETDLTDIRLVRCISNNVLAIASRDPGKDRCLLSIWSDIRSNEPPSLETILTFDDTIMDMAWHLSSDAQFILAVAFKNRVAIYGQQRATDAESTRAPWICYSEFSNDYPGDSVRVLWIDHGILAVLAGNRILCYPKWLSPQDRLPQDTSQTLQKELMSNIYDLSCALNGPLPFYHPNHLIHYLMWGKIDLINAVLLSMYRFLKHLVEEDNLTIPYVPPLSISLILRLQNEDKGKSKPLQQQYTALFGDDDQADTLSDDEDDTRPLSRSESKSLAELLRRYRLPMLSGREDMHLVAMVDTFVEISAQGSSLDENGARFMALLENCHHLNKMLAADQQSTSLRSSDLVWALHSQSQDILLERCIHLCGGKLMWPEARALGIFLWLQKSESVADQMTAIARNTYLAQDTKDPISCTLFYLALRKKSLLQSLWHKATHHKEHTVMVKFLANDFSDPRWQKAAAKNAFVLLGRQRYEYAAAFFLLADRLKDAVGIILKHVQDYQLAIAICRVYDGDHSALLKDILRDHVLPLAVDTHDRWLASMAFWLLGDQTKATAATMENLSDLLQDKKSSQQNIDATVTDPNLFILYQHLKQTAAGTRPLGLSYAAEYMFSLNVSRAYERLGCPLLGLYILEHFQMAKPTAAPEEDEKEKEEGKAHHAADLFADDEPKPLSRAQDLFADDSPPPMSRAADLFADEEEPKQQSRAEDLFADGPSVSRSMDIFAGEPVSNDLFADEPFTSQTGGLFSDDDADSNASAEEALPEDESLKMYKALLVIRPLQTFFLAASAIYDTAIAPLLSHVNGYKESYAERREELVTFAESFHIPRDIFLRLLRQKSIEADTFALYLRATRDAADDTKAPAFLSAFRASCVQVYRLAMGYQELGYAELAFCEKWDGHTIDTFGLWSHMQSKTDRPFLETQKVILGTFLSLLTVTLRQRHLEKSWTLLIHLKGLLDGLSTREQIQQTLERLEQGESKMAETDMDDIETFSEDSLFGYNMEEEVYQPLKDYKDTSAGAQLLEVASLAYMVSVLEHWMQHAENNPALSNDLLSLLWTDTLDTVAYRTHKLKESIREQLENDLTRRNVLRQFRTLRQKKYWHSLRSLRTPEKLLPFVDFSPSEINIFAEPTQRQPQSVYVTPTTAHAFAMNSTCSEIVAVCMKSEIQEIDLNSARHFGAVPLMRTNSASSVGHDHPHHNNHHHSDSYPDTEEELDESDADTLSEVGTPKANKREPLRVPSHLAPGRLQGRTPTGAASPASLRVPDSSPNVNLESLHDSLKRSLGIPSKESSGGDPTRSPAGASSVDSSADMVGLKRNMSATCAEAHPQFPFYITGCEVTNGGPSVVLWQFGQEREVASYYGGHGKTTRVHFDPHGQRFAAGDTTGGLLFWRFDSHSHSNKPYYTLPACHSKATRDFTFTSASSLVASAGTSVAMSRRREHVCLWDTLLPPSKALVCSLPAHDSGAYAIAYDPDRSLLFSGGKRGDIAVSDIRQRSVVHTFTAHPGRIRSISIANNTLVTGSVDGELKLWDAS